MVDPKVIQELALNEAILLVRMHFPVRNKPHANINQPVLEYDTIDLVNTRKNKFCNQHANLIVFILAFIR